MHPARQPSRRLAGGRVPDPLGHDHERVAAYTYNSHGHMTQFTDENGAVTTYTYSSTGDLASVTAAFTSTTSYADDTLGRQISLTTPTGQITIFTYDALDRITSVTLPKPAASSVHFVTSYSYDNYDSGIGLAFATVTDPNGRITKSGYDALGNLLQAVDAVGNVTNYTYQYNLLAKITDANGNQTSFTHNGSGDLTDVTFPDGASEHYSVTNGVPFWKIDRNGQGVSYWYDSIGRLQAVSYPGLTGPGGVIVGQTYTYDDQNLIQVVDTQPAAKTQYLFTYDSSWRRTSEQIVGGGTTTYTWIGSLLQSYTIAPGYGNTGTTQAVTYGYDSFGRVLAIQWSWIQGQAFLFAYNSNGQYSTITFPNGQSRVFAYDNQGRLTNLTNKDIAGNTLASFAYGYDYDWASGSYSMLGQRTSMTLAAVPGTVLAAGLTKYQYDSRCQLTRADPPTDPYDTWTYDAIGNRTSSRYLTYSYYKNGQNTLNGQRIRSVSGSPDYNYDAAGNLTGNVSLPNLYTWDYAGRLASASGTSSTSFTYDYLGRRTTATSANTTTRYISLGQHTVGERNTTLGVSTDYVFGPGIDEPLAKRTADGAISYYGADGLGSIMLITDANATVTGSAAYDAWGTRGGGSELFGYTGRETGGPLWFYRARYYDPSIGRFLSEDPLRSSETHFGVRGNVFAFENAYLYAVNGPIIGKDPLGLYGTNDCSYYKMRCQQSGGQYYCKTAPYFCDQFFPKMPDPDPNRDDDYEGWPRCVRRCLQDCDSDWFRQRSSSFPDKGCQPGYPYGPSNPD
jgi:RHS repeat-associated protein